jgi:uncharacterized protein YutE (UPF0331/DUF86 family)
MREVDNILKENRSKEAIENTLQTICSKLPSTISKECSDFVSQYADLVIDLLINEVDPKNVCTALKVCSNIRNALLHTAQFLPIPGHGKINTSVYVQKGSPSYRPVPVYPGSR